jgi:protein-S-isoprenylcysteine O-methyltransferase Ste14
VLLTIAWISFFVPLLWVATPWFDFAEFTLHLTPLAAGIALFAVGLWLFYRSHVDLGPNWSITLEVREQHRLVTAGQYHRIRHPMYLALLVYSLGQALVIPNWLAGPSYAVAMALLIGLRIGPEERMMRERFGGDYDRYAAHTARLLPGVW